MLDTETKINLFLLQYCRLLTADVPDERLAEEPLPGVNHPAWILGHLGWSSDRALELLGAAKTLPSEWTPLFGPGSKHAPGREAYPSKEELLRALEHGFERVRQRASAATPEQLAQPTINPRMKGALPTVQHGVAFLMTAHLGVHLGQLSSWRRMIGLAPLF